MSKIFDNLYLGSYSDARNQNFLKRVGITHIVTVGVELQKLYPQNYKYLYIPAYDNPSYKLDVYFDQIADFIHNAIENEGGKVFVHCYMGISRSTTSVIAYMIKYHKIPPLKAKTFVRSKRSIIYPNDGFMRQLNFYAKKLGVVEESQIGMAKTFSTSFPKLQQTITKKEEEVKSLSNSLDIRGTTLTGRFYKTGGLEESKENKVVSGGKEYHCKTCAMKVFGTSDIEHDINKNESMLCSTIYLRYMPWIGYAKTNSGKIFCPNTKCNSILGFYNVNGGKCLCGKRIDRMYAIYPLRVVSAKGKGLVEKAF